MINEIQYANSLTITGINTNITNILFKRIWLMHNGTIIKNVLPDLTKWRKWGEDTNDYSQEELKEIEKDYLVGHGFNNDGLVEVVDSDNRNDSRKNVTRFDTPQELLNNLKNINKIDENKKDPKPSDDNILGIENKNGETVDKVHRDALNYSKTDEKLNIHQFKLKTIVEILLDKPLATDYIYDEVERIHKTGIIKDSLRVMVMELQKPENAEMRAEVLKYYDVIKGKMKEKSISLPQVNEFKNTSST